MDTQTPNYTGTYQVGGGKVGSCSSSDSFRTHLYLLPRILRTANIKATSIPYCCPPVHPQHFMSNILHRIRQQVSHLSKFPTTPILAPARAARFSTMSVRSNSLLSVLVLLFSAIVVLLLNRTPSQDNKATITDWVKPDDKSGEFKRQQSAFRNFISKDANSEFPAEKDRYHLYVSYACPWGM